MAGNFEVCSALLGAMDRLWFHQIILFPEPISLPVPKNLETSEPMISESLISFRSSISSCTSIPEEHDSLPDESAPTPQQDNDSEIEESTKIIEVLKKTRPSRLNIKVDSQSLSSPSSPNKLSKNKKYSGSVTSLGKTMSCKSLGELEVEEVKGFMDLGFRFDTEHLCPRMMTVVPGLQRLGRYNSINLVQKDNNMEVVAVTTDKDDDHQVLIDEDDDHVTKRPYLSEAWLIRRPDSPLLNLKIPKASAAADMKKHLKYWARTVASVVQQES